MELLVPHPPGAASNSEARQSKATGPAHRFFKRRLLPLFAALLAAGALTLGSSTPAQAADMQCPDNAVCVWNGANFENAKRSIGTGESGYWMAFDNYKLSIRNRFGQRVVWTYSPFVGFRCWAPNASAGTWVAETHLYIGAIGSRC